MTVEIKAEGVCGMTVSLELIKEGGMNEPGWKQFVRFVAKGSVSIDQDIEIGRVLARE